MEHTLTFWPIPVNTSAADQDIVDDGKDAFTCNPLALFVLDSAIIQVGRFI